MYHPEYKFSASMVILAEIKRIFSLYIWELDPFTSSCTVIDQLEGYYSALEKLG